MNVRERPFSRAFLCDMTCQLRGPALQLPWSSKECGKYSSILWLRQTTRDVHGCAVLYGARRLKLAGPGQLGKSQLSKCAAFTTCLQEHLWQTISRLLARPRQHARATRPFLLALELAPLAWSFRSALHALMMGMQLVWDGSAAATGNAKSPRVVGSRCLFVFRQ